MIAGIFHEGSGLGDQLFRYITVRTLAEQKGWGFGMCNYSLFKGNDFLKLDTGVPIGTPEALTNKASGVKVFKRWNEREVRDPQGNDVRSYDPEINFVEDRTIIDGSFEDDKYWRNNLPNISKWLAVEPLFVPDDLCVVGFRGGEYAMYPDLFLTEDYWNETTDLVRNSVENVRFQVHTDDPERAKRQFHDFEVIDNLKISHSKHSNMGFNWRSMRYAKYAIIPNSAFYILPRILKHHEDPEAITIAPRYWARRNTRGPWRPACYYPEFTYL